MMPNFSNISSIDISGLHEDYETWPIHFSKALNFPLNFSLPSNPAGVIFVGMGGSGSACEVVLNWSLINSKIPLILWKTYDLPTFVTKDWIVIAVSLSGNTDETLSALNLAHHLGSYSIGLSSGGKLENFCNSNSIQHIKLSKLKTPRSSFPYLAIILSRIISEIDEIDVQKNEIKDSLEDVNSIHNDVNINVDFDKNPAKKLASYINLSIPMIYSSSQLWPISVRFQDSLNENAKLHAFAEQLPESCHNDIESWRKDNLEIYSCVIISSEYDLEPIKKRIKFLKEMIHFSGCSVYDIQTKGSNHLGRLFSTIYLLDYTSVYLSILRNIDPTPTLNIEKLKEKLKQ